MDKNLARVLELQDELQKAVDEYQGAFRNPTAGMLRPFTGATAFNDANAWINGQGNLSLGNSGRDDASGDPAALYAKGDVFVNIPLNWLTSVTQALTFARTSAGIYTTALAAAASTGVLIIPLTGLFRKFSQVSGGVNNPHGFKVLDVVLNYTIGTAAETSITPSFVTETQTNNTARAATTTPLGATVTVENPIGTVVANLPTAVQAAPYVTRFYGSAPVFVNTDNTDLYAEVAFVNPGTSVATITHVGFHASVALY